jgi:hypothetical protein
MSRADGTISCFAWPMSSTEGSGSTASTMVKQDGMFAMKFEQATPVSLKTHTMFNEKWLQQRLAEDPSLLGLGDLEVKDLERRQPRAGRLDLLLTDPETHTRYEVEIQLGATDEVHIIRTIEYWDIEKSRYPQYEHVAVLVAEDITSRFLNVIALFNKAIPLVAIQMRALEVGGVLTLQATTVMDLLPLGTDEEDEPGQATDRSYWIKRGSEKSVAVADALLELINEVTGDSLALKYNKHYIGLSRGGVADNFMSFRARKDYLIAEFRIPRSDDVTSSVEDSGIDSLPYDKRWGYYRLRLTEPEVHKQRDLLVDLVARASGTPAPVND